MRLCRVLAALLLFTSTSAADELRTLDGRTIAGELLSLSDKAVALRAEGKEITTPNHEVLHIDFQPPGKVGTSKYIDVELLDGSLLHCTQVTLRGKEVELNLVTGQEKVKVPLAGVTYIVNDAHDAKLMEKFRDVLAEKRSSDRLVVLREGRLDPLNGTFGDADADGKTIAFDLNSGGSPRPVRLERVHALIFLRTAGEATPAICKLLDTQTNVVAVSVVQVTPAGFTVTTPSGARIEYPRAQVARFDYSQGKLTYLSDLPVKVTEDKELGRLFNWRKDRNLDGSEIRLGNQKYSKGLSIFAPVQMEFDLRGDYRELKAVLGVDDQLRSEGPVQVKFEADGQELLSVVVASGEKPRPITLLVKDRQRLRISVAANEGLDIPNKHVALGDAKVSK